MTCVTEGCDRPVQNKRHQLCLTCNTKRLKAGTKCILCTKPIKARGLCNAHYHKWHDGRIQVEPLPPEEMAVVIHRALFTCDADGCNANVKTNKFCETHTHRVYVRRSPKTCAVGECENAVRTNTYCPEHTEKPKRPARKTCAADGCDARVRTRTYCRTHLAEPVKPKRPARKPAPVSGIDYFDALVEKMRRA